MSGSSRSDQYLTTLRRTNYFTGRFLSADDFEREQQYHRQARYLHNRALGHGIVEGLTVRVYGTGIRVSPGFAIDSLGRELVLPKAARVTVDDDAFLSSAHPAVTATWGEILEDPIPSSDLTSDAVQFSTWVERPVIAIDPLDVIQPPTLLLARLTRNRKGALAIDFAGRDDFRVRFLPHD